MANSKNLKWSHTCKVNYMKQVVPKTKSSNKLYHNGSRIMKLNKLKKHLQVISHHAATCHILAQLQLVILCTFQTTTMNKCTYDEPACQQLNCTYSCRHGELQEDVCPSIKSRQAMPLHLQTKTGMCELSYYIHGLSTKLLIGTINNNYWLSVVYMVLMMQQYNGT